MAGSDRETAYSRILAFENAMCRRYGYSRMQRYQRNLQYHSGENLPPDNIEQPLGINYAKTINEKHCHYLFGQWDEGKDIIGWRVQPPGDATDADRELARVITQHCYQLARQNNADILLFEGGMNGSIFGDTVLRVTLDEANRRVRWESILPEYVHFRWSPTDMNEITEMIVSYPMARSDAKEMYGTYGSPLYKSPSIDQAMMGFAIYWELWTPEKFEQWIDDIRVKTVPNPYIWLDGTGIARPGVIPSVHIPNTRAGGDFYGFADSEPMFLIQDELNRKMADQGDIINNFAHPITVINNWYGDVDELPVGPDQVWDLGKEGKATLLQWSGSPPAVQEYVSNLMGIMFDLASMSPVAYARHKGTQQSAIALAIEMMPVTERARWKRMYWTNALRKLIQMSVYLEQVGGIPLPFTYEDLQRFDIQLSWAPMLPRDRMALVQENVTMVINRLRSIERALEEMGDPDPQKEREKILKDVKELIKLGAKLPTQGSAGGTGSSSLPDGITEAKLAGRPATAGATRES